MKYDKNNDTRAAKMISEHDRAYNYISNYLDDLIEMQKTGEHPHYDHYTNEKIGKRNTLAQLVRYIIKDNSSLRDTLLRVDLEDRAVSEAYELFEEHFPLFPRTYTIAYRLEWLINEYKIVKKALDAADPTNRY
jgi:hypothetical protein